MCLKYVLWYVWFTINHDIKKKSEDYFYQAEYFDNSNLEWNSYILCPKKCGNFDKI